MKTICPVCASDFVARYGAPAPGEDDMAKCEFCGSVWALDANGRPGRIRRYRKLHTLPFVRRMFFNRCRSPQFCLRYGQIPNTCANCGYFKPRDDVRDLGF